MIQLPELAANPLNGLFFYLQYSFPYTQNHGHDLQIKTSSSLPTSLYLRFATFLVSKASVLKKVLDYDQK